MFLLRALITQDDGTIGSSEDVSRFDTFEDALDVAKEAIQADSPIDVIEIVGPNGVVETLSKISRN